jgi:hypothetical protein
MKSVCEDLDVAALKPTLQRQLKRMAVSQDMRDFAAVFVVLQEARHRADYDPQAVIVHSDATDSVGQAGLALQAFDRALPEEQADILALMLVARWR